MWQCENDNGKITSNGKFIATLLPFKLFEYTFLLSSEENPQLNFDLVFSNKNGKNLNFGLRAIKKDEIINAELWTPMQNFKNISLNFTDIFCKKSAICNMVHIFGIWGLEKLWSDFDNFHTRYGKLQRHYFCIVLSEYIHRCLICVLESEEIRWNLKWCYIGSRGGCSPNFSINIL